MPALFPPGFPTDSELGRLLGKVGELIGERRFADAIPLMTKAVELVPDNGPCHANLGGLYIETGQYAKAVPALQRAAAINPRIALIQWRLGTALQMTGDTQRAIAAFETALELRPDLVDARLRLGLLYRQLGRRHESREQYNIAAEYTDEPGRKLLLEAEALLDERREKEAEALLRSALELDPALQSAHGILGQILSGSGRFDEAEKHFEAELVLSPNSVRAFYDLVRCRKFTEADEGLLQRIDAAIDVPAIEDIERSVLLLARSKLLDDVGRYEQAMQSMDEAAVLRARAFAIDVAEFETKVDAIIALFSSEMLARFRSGSTDRTPVFILGMPRSGTTLVEQIISSHPKADGADELTFWAKRLETVLGSGVLSDDFLQSSAADYLAVLRASFPTAARISEKFPFNFLAVGLIHLAFPGAAIIHCRRNPIDTALSIHQIHFTRSTAMPTGGDDLVRYFAAYHKLMEHWRRVLPPGRMYEVRYETFTASPHTEIPKLIAHIGLEWDPICLTPNVNSRLVRTPSGWQVRQSINTGSVGRWRNYEKWLGPLAPLVERQPAS